MVDEMGFWPRFVVAVFATWRVTHLLANEDGPAELIIRRRARLGGGFVGKLMDCFQCLSLWVAMPMALFVSRKPPGFLFAWVALSGAACLLERGDSDPVIIQPASQTKSGGLEDGVLW